MIISPPFLPASNSDDEIFVRDAMLDAVDIAPGSGGAPLGSYPLTTALTWHNGLHLSAPRDTLAQPAQAQQHLAVRAIADGTVVFKRAPKAATTTATDPQNYNPYGNTPAWTDNGIVIVRHTTDIGATGNTPTSVTYYSVYMHLSRIDAAVSENHPIWRKDIIGTAGQIYGRDHQIHSEVCLSPAELQKLVGTQRPITWTDPATVPTVDGRTDAVFGSLYVYLPAGTPTCAVSPTSHLRRSSPTGGASAATGHFVPDTLHAAQWVEISYNKGNAIVSSYRASDGAGGVHAGDPIGQPLPQADFEYDLYTKASERHASVVAAGVTSSSPSGWYELLRFGRNLGVDPLPTNAAHWREIPTDSGTVWADLNAPGTFKFSDADFPAFKGWNCFDDDPSPDNQRCDSIQLKRAIRDPEVPESIRERVMLARRLGEASVREKFKRAICMFPTEWDKSTIMQRYDWLKVDEEFKIGEGREWDEFKAHAESISFDGLPQEYKDAVWHIHPRTFIVHLRKCWRVQKKDLQKIFENIAEPYLTQVADEINRLSGKHFLNSALRQSHFFGQVRQEAGATMAATSENLNYAPSVLVSKFSYYQRNPTEASADGYTKINGRITNPANQEVIANKAYGGPRLGNTQPGDGWRFRGRGLKQITGRKNYGDFKAEYPKYWAMDYQDFVAMPELVMQFPYSIRSAVWFWEGRRCARAADKGIGDLQVDAISDIVNSG